jgi:hypothetical protein
MQFQWFCLLFGVSIYEKLSQTLYLTVPIMQMIQNTAI